MTDEMKTQMITLKKCFPYRIVWGKLDKDSGEFEVFATPTKHAMNKAVREGHKVWMI